MIEADPKEALPQLRKLIPDVVCTIITDYINCILQLYKLYIITQVQCLKRVVLMPGYTSSSEYDISGVTDPFLQVRELFFYTK